MKKFVMYTAHFGRAGRYRRHESSLPNVDKIYFTDVPDVKEGRHHIMPVGKGQLVKNDIYHIKQMDLNHIKGLPILRQRFVKIRIPDEIFNNYEYSVYVDIKRPYSIDFERMLSCLELDTDILLQQHRARDCAYDEGKFLLRKGIYDSEAILRQMDFYKKEKFPAHNGLYVTGQLFRRHTKRLKDFLKLWWEQVESFSYRDQLSFPYAMWKDGMRISTFPSRHRRR